MYPHFESWPELPRIERPGRYLGGEVEARPNQAPDAQGRLMRVALAFSDVFEIAHGHLGHKILYSLVNGRAGLSAERVYAPWPDWEAALRKRGQALTSLESRRELADFDLVGFSLQYELGYTNILAMLEMGRIPLRAADRNDRHPLVAAGGPGACNPEPLADFFDLFFLGDAERGFINDLEIIKEWRAEGAPKDELWDRLAGRPGIYIPSLFRPRRHADGRLAAVEPLRPGYARVTRAVAPSLETAPFPLCQITPLIKPVHDRIVVEIGRGCSRGCRFCQAGYVYRPVRERRQDTVLDLARQNLTASGQDEVSFLSLSAGDHTEIDTMVSGFMDEYAARTVALSLPSLRVKSLSGHLARQIRRVRKTGFTLAPEAGTQRLRDVINKDLTDDDLFAAADRAFSLGWRTLKLYFMVGLPTETDDDLAGLAELARRLKKMGRAQINLGVAHFTPKAHTPFQWHPASGVAAISERLHKVRDLCRAPGLTPKWNEPGASWVESILARGDRRLGPVLERVYRAGARFEAWGDRFDAALWTEALAAEGLDQERLLNPFGPDDPRPYGHLFAGVTDDFLKGELAKAERGETTADCRWDRCLGCGACHDGAKIDLAGAGSARDNSAPASLDGADKRDHSAEPQQSATENPQFVLLVNFKKSGRAAFLGHLELVELFKRAFRRAGLELAMSQGFHPQPRLSFLTALPLGVESEDEYLRAVCPAALPAEEAAQRLAAQLPGDVVIKDARWLAAGRAKPRPQAVIWRVEAEGPIFRPGPPLHPEAVLRYTDERKGAREYPLADFVPEAHATPDAVTLAITLGLHGTPKPAAAAAALWGLDPANLALRVFKVKTVLAE